MVSDHSTSHSEDLSGSGFPEPQQGKLKLNELSPDASLNIYTEAVDQEREDLVGIPDSDPHDVVRLRQLPSRWNPSCYEIDHPDFGEEGIFSNDTEVSWTTVDSGYADGREDVQAMEDNLYRFNCMLDVFDPSRSRNTPRNEEPICFPVTETLNNATRLNAETESMFQTRSTQVRGTIETVKEPLSMPEGLICQDGEDLCPKTTETPASQSSSGSVVTQLTGTTDSDIAADMMSTVGVRDVYDKLLDFFSRFIEFKLHITGTQQRGGASSRSNPRAQIKSTSVDGSQSQTAKGKRKRVLQADDSFDDSGEAPDDGEPEAKRRKTEKLKIVCPYMKRYPAEFCSWTTCVGPGFDGMNRMKEHLKRKHYKDNGCHRCGLHLDSYEALQEHLRAAEICDVSEILPQMGFMTQIQWEHISKKRQSRKTPLLERWKEIYLILFPDADENSIPSPYFDASETSDGLSNIFDPREYECFLKQHLPARILMNLNREFQIISDLAKAKLAEILQEESLEVLKAYVLQKGGNLSQTSDQQTNSPGTERLASGANDSCLFDNIEAFGDEGQDEFDFSFLEAFCQQADKEGSEQTDSGHGSSIM